MKTSRALCLGSALLGLAVAGYAQDIELPLGRAQFFWGGVRQDIGKATLPFQMVRKEPFSELRWTVDDALEAGEYYLVLTSYHGGFHDFASGIRFFVNDELAGPTVVSVPRHAKGGYSSELWLRRKVAIHRGDLIRLVAQNHLSFGGLRLSRQPLAQEFFTVSDDTTGSCPWLAASVTGYGAKEGRLWVEYRCLNPGLRPLKAKTGATAKDYELNVLYEQAQDVDIAPGSTMTNRVEFAAGRGRWSRIEIRIENDKGDREVLTQAWAHDEKEAPRRRFCLNGDDWEVVQLAADRPGDVPPADAAWKKTAVPTVGIDPNKGECAWFRKTFTAPSFVEGEDVYLSFEKILQEAWIYLNGRLVEHRYRAFRPFKVKVNESLRPHATNVLLVAARGPIGYKIETQAALRDGRALTPYNPGRTSGWLEYPGERDDRWMGIDRSVYLETAPRVHVEDRDIVTSYRDKTLAVTLRLRNTGAAPRRATVTPAVYDAGRRVLDLGSQSVELAPGALTETTFRMRWRNPRLWFPTDPHLYVLKTEVRPDEGAADLDVERFGFRDVWIDGYSYLLNGMRIKPCGAWSADPDGIRDGNILSAWDPSERVTAKFRHMIQKRAIGLMFGRFGTYFALDAADEIGVMAKPEANMGQALFVDDDLHWEMIKRNSREMAQQCKNHACVVSWSCGNENLWGWYHISDEVKRSASDRQVDAALALEAADPQGRPADWDGDADLCGKWKVACLHYPRETGGSPDLPVGMWWGDITKNEAFPTALGEIVLGSKPITIGETGWVASDHQPYGPMPLMGDLGFRSPYLWRRAGLEARRFALAAMRDAECTMTAVDGRDLPLLTPFKVVLKDESFSFYGGSRLTRAYNLHNDNYRKARVEFIWSLKGNGWTKGDTQRLTLAPAECRRGKLDIRLPKVRGPEEAVFTALMKEDGKIVDRETRTWRISPEVALAYAGRPLLVVDPVGDTHRVLERNRIACERIGERDIPMSGEGKSLLIARDALKDSNQLVHERVNGFASSGGKVLLLTHDRSLNWIQSDFSLITSKAATLGYRRTEDHPITAQVSDEDLRWWAPDEYVSRGFIRKPTRGNFMPIVDTGTSGGYDEALILELYQGRGSIVLSIMPIFDRLDASPGAARLAAGALNYLGQDKVYRQCQGKLGIRLAAGSALTRRLRDIGAVCEPLPEAGDWSGYGAVLVDAAQLAGPAAAPLKAYVERGGTLVVNEVGPEHVEALTALTGCAWTLHPVSQQPTDIKNHVLRLSNAGAMAGISNFELVWLNNNWTAKVLQMHSLFTYRYECPTNEFIAEAFLEPGAPEPGVTVEPLTVPAALVRVARGKGTVLVNQLHLAQRPEEQATKADRLLSLLMTNLGIGVEKAESAAEARIRRFAEYSFFTVDLAPYANRSTHHRPALGLKGWTNQGTIDAATLPTGRQVMGGLPVFIAEPKGVVCLYSTMANNDEMPKSVTIGIARKADVLFFFHASAWTGPTWPKEHPCFRYKVRFADGTAEDIPIVANRNLIDWFNSDTAFAEEKLRLNNAYPVFQGTMAKLSDHRFNLWAYEWQNPAPDKVVAAVEFMHDPESGYRTTMPVPVLWGLTGARKMADTGKVVDVIGTAGVKVEIGDSVIPVFYLGVSGLESVHPFAKEAEERHRGHVVGKTVLLKTRTYSGRDASLYAYVYDAAAPNSSPINMWALGEGLGRLGPFFGKTDLAPEMFNLEYITSEQKKGVWGFK